MSYLTPEAKSKLSSTIRALRERLLTDLQNAVESTYRLSITAVSKAGLAEEQRVKRQRLEQWLDEQSRSQGKSKKQENEIGDRYLKTAVKLAAATLLNRLIVIKQMEAHGLSKPAVLTGGWQSRGYREFRDFAPDLCKDETEGYGTLLQLLYDELAQELPGLFGNVGVTALFPIPASTLRAAIEALDAAELKDVWLDDTTLGWVYQYWNDPEREALDAKLNGGGKVEPHEIASKTQMFTERYMVEWLLHNSLGQMWLAMCKKHGWTAEVEADGTLARLEARRKEWREKREQGEVALDALMPIEPGIEENWKYWVPQPLTADAVTHAPESVRSLKILDPATGSAHFLVIAFGLLFTLYQEEARHRGENWSDRQIVESILENNLYGVDIDPRAIQIGAAALILKARLLSPQASPKHLNLVASNLQLASLPADDPALVELRREVTEATGIPEKLTNQIVYALQGADYLGTLLKVDTAVDAAISEYESQFQQAVQGNIFAGFGEQKPDFNFQQTKASLLDKLEQFLSRCTSGDDLGLRLRGEQLAAGIRFIRIARENSYDLVIGNPPYQGTSKMADAGYITKNYSKGKADLYTAFLERGLQLAKVGGLSALLTMRNWMFIQQFTQIREYLLSNFDLRLLGDVDRGAFEEVVDEVVATVMSVFQKATSNKAFSIAIQPTPLDDNSRDSGRTKRKRAAILLQIGRFEFWSHRFDVIKEKPLVYWWNKAFLKRYAETPKLGDISPSWQGVATTNNTRFLRKVWEVNINKILIAKTTDLMKEQQNETWSPYIKGASGQIWIESLSNLVEWQMKGWTLNAHLEFYREKHPALHLKDNTKYFNPAVAFSCIGAEFSARIHRYRSVIGDKGSSVFTQDLANVTCLLNSKIGRNVMASLNPSISFQVGDVNRLPLFPIESADEIFTQLDAAFSEHEAARETSVEFKKPGASVWNYAQEWAQTAVDREPGIPLPNYEPVYEDPPATNFASYTIGVALGRFGADGEGILNQAPATALPHSILYLSAYSEKDSLEHPACKPIQETWHEYGSIIAKGTQLRKWLRLSFFKEVHLGMYESRPIYFPLSSQRKNFVAFVSIHRWADNTLQTLLADYLIPELSQLEGELNDLTTARHQGDKKTQTKAEERYSEVQKLHEEFKAFIDLVRQCAEQGPIPANARDIPREVDARFKMDLDDGVMVNSAALWPLLEPQWNQPKKWWSELCNAEGKKDYDWSHLAARYFPKRVDGKCKQDPSLAVAHSCFWKYHPAKAYEWELRLQDEISEDFTIEETDSNTLRLAFARENPQLVREIIEKEEKRRERKRKKEETQEEDYGPLFEQEEEAA
ncbi:SAM-dependent methyltransferase [Nostoc sp. 'Peltigera membranacea cyanobiont' 210A]|uniref:BREX-6 system adenine-specific DNA-methyltransferase PglX n=1 Tax=Nostoc sp. 'Peltigera membranacea cyanobiont' 210A TaxID=2014529 RepID=UPI000B955B65|nr:BREX-6 system adenine-specific DNA-methyltransferase PglX [Nostoc sp. 'Peltigera membranacea cyanobiont' 210A]OYD91577.1 SAM-dependent methyltransferase [Nostoc sp. 'Peltigera membranacea cyanobiont' 210A]